jgi:2-dehydro-3-deoxy-D-gluconate 5-dehydrogenase
VTDLAGQTAVVTGGGRGLGRGITEALLRAGAEVVVLQRSDLPADLARDGLTLKKVDLCQVGETEQAIRSVLADRQVDILVNNAGVQARHPAVEFPLEAFQRVLDVNVRATFQLCQGFGREMLLRGRGKIVNVASLLSFQGGLTVPAYAASKAAVMGLTKALCNEWAGSGVNVNAIAPGYMDSEMTAALIADPIRSREIRARIPTGRWGQPADLGGAVVFLASSASDYVNGIVLPVDGGWLAR